MTEYEQENGDVPADDFPANGVPAEASEKAPFPRRAFRISVCAAAVLAIAALIFLGVQLTDWLSDDSEGDFGEDETEDVSDEDDFGEDDSDEEDSDEDEFEAAISKDVVFRFEFSQDGAVPETNVGGWNWIYNAAENGVPEKPEISDGVAQFSRGGARSESEVDFDCAQFVCAFEIAEARGEHPEIVIAFGKTESGQTVAEPGFYVKATRDSVQLEDQKTGEIVVEAKNLELGAASFTKIIVVNTPRGSAIFADGNAVAHSEKSVSGRARQFFGIGCGNGLPGVGRFRENYGKLNAKLRGAAVFGKNLNWSAETPVLDKDDAALFAERGISVPKTFAPAAPAVSAGELTGFLASPVFRFDFSGDSPFPSVNDSGWNWRFRRRGDGVVEKPSVSGGVGEFSVGGACTVGNVRFDCSAFSCEFEIANVRNAVPAIVLALGSAEGGRPAAEAGFFVKISQNSIQLENQQTGEIAIEARGLDFGGNVFRRVSVVNAPTGSSIVVDGAVVAHSEKSVSGAARQPFGIGGVYGLSGSVPERGGAAYEKLNAQLRQVALFSGRTDAESTRRVPSLFLLSETAADAALAAAAAGDSVAGTASAGKVREKRSTPADANYGAKWPAASRLVGYWGFETVQKTSRRQIFDTKHFRIIFDGEKPLMPIAVKETTRILEGTRAAVSALPLDPPCRRYDVEKDGRYVLRMFTSFTNYSFAGGKSGNSMSSVLSALSLSSEISGSGSKRKKKKARSLFPEPYLSGTYLGGNGEKPGIVLMPMYSMSIGPLPKPRGKRRIPPPPKRYGKWEKRVAHAALVREVTLQMLDPEGVFPPWLRNGLSQYVVHSYQSRGNFVFQKCRSALVSYFYPFSMPEKDAKRMLGLQHGSKSIRVLPVFTDPETFFTSSQELSEKNDEVGHDPVSTALVYYFIHLDGNRDGARFKKYVEAIRNGESPKEAIEILRDGRSWQTLVNEMRRKMLPAFKGIYVAFNRTWDPTKLYD